MIFNQRLKLVNWHGLQTVTRNLEKVGHFLNGYLRESVGPYIPQSGN
jgi:hypothetical protein